LEALIGLSRRVATSIVVILIVLQVLATSAVWAFSTVGAESENLFALFTAVNLVAFAMVSYLYRSHKDSQPPNHGAMYLGFGVILLLLIVALFI
jgi:hypothetical protein